MRVATGVEQADRAVGVVMFDSIARRSRPTARLWNRRRWLETCAAISAVKCASFCREAGAAGKFGYARVQPLAGEWGDLRVAE
jgi:hypothetical protein